MSVDEAEDMCGLSGRSIYEDDGVGTGAMRGRGFLDQAINA